MFYLDNPLIYESVSQRLSQLAACGIKLFPQSTLDDVITALCFDPTLGDSEVDLIPSDVDILAAISFNCDFPEWGFLFHEYEARMPLSDSVWSFDEECIYKEEDYIDIIKAMRTLAGDHLPIQKISVRFDKEKGLAHVRFELDGQFHEWDLRLHFDWLDRSILTALARLLRKRSPSMRLAMHRENTADSYMVCLPIEQIEKINQMMDLRFEYL